MRKYFFIIFWNCTHVYKAHRNIYVMLRAIVFFTGTNIVKSRSLMACRYIEKWKNATLCSINFNSSKYKNLCYNNAISLFKCYMKYKRNSIYTARFDMILCSRPYNYIRVCYIPINRSYYSSSCYRKWI